MINNSVPQQLPPAKTMIVNDIPVIYYEEGTGETLVLLHGWPQTSYIWRKIFPELARQYHVIAVDLPGMGNTHKTTTADTKTVATFLKQFFDQLKLAQINLIAHDIGAWVAVTFALEYESSLRSLMVMDAGIPGLMPDEVFLPANAGKIWQFYFHAVHDIPEFLLEGKEKEYFTWYFTNKSVVKDAINGDDIEVYYQAYKGKEVLSNGFAYYREFSHSAKQNLDYKKQLTLPILAIGAAQSQGLNVARAMNKVSKNKVKEINIPNCGHYISEERPEKLLSSIREFVG